MNTFVLIVGLQGTGKTTVATHLAKRLNATVISTEMVRHALFKPIRAPGSDTDFTENEMMVTYRAVNHFVSLLAASPINVVVEGVFRYKAQRDDLLSLLANTQVLKVYLHCEDSVVETRLHARQSGDTMAPAGINTHRQVRAQFELPAKDYVDCDTGLLAPNDIAEYLITKHLQHLNPNL